MNACMHDLKLGCSVNVYVCMCTKVHEVKGSRLVGGFSGNPAKGKLT